MSQLLDDTGQQFFFNFRGDSITAEVSEFVTVTRPGVRPIGIKQNVQATVNHTPSD